MKRISFLSISMLLIFCASSNSRDYSYVPLRYRVHWSPYQQGLVSGNVKYTPYALTYESNGLTSGYQKYSPYALGYGGNGLVCGTLHYSPYALSFGSSGLVERETHYNPYAFGYKSSGLVSAVSGCGCYANQYYGSEIVVVHSITGYPNTENCMSESFTANAEEINAEKAADRTKKLTKQKEQLKKINLEKASDPSEAIRQVLESRNIQFRTDRYFRMNGKTISVNFVIEDANMIIKFWNPSEIAEINKDDHKKKLFEDYLKSWEDYCLNNIGNSKKIYNIFSSSREELFEQFAYSESVRSDDAQYALAQK